MAGRYAADYGACGTVFLSRELLEPNGAGGGEHQPEAQSVARGGNARARWGGDSEPGGSDATTEGEPQRHRAEAAAARAGS